MPRKNYAVEAAKLATAIDLAIAAFKKYPPKDFEKDHLLQVVQGYTEMKMQALNPAPEFKNMVALNYLVQDALTYFQEGVGEAVTYFWKQLAEANLGFVREDKLRKVIGRKRIKGRAEYDLVTDTFIAAEQEGRISQEEARVLSRMLGDFENRIK